MQSQSWQASLKASLTPSKRAEQPVRLAVLGIGHELCGDDAVGVRLAGMLRPLVTGNERLLVIEAGPAPENFTGPLRRFQPDLVPGGGPGQGCPIHRRGKTYPLRTE